MKHKIDCNLSVNTDTDSRELKCIIDENKRTVFDFTYELLNQEKFQNLNEKSSKGDFYKAIEKFLICELNNNTLRDLYPVRADNFWKYNN